MERGLECPQLPDSVMGDDRRLHSCFEQQSGRYDSRRAVPRIPTVVQFEIGKDDQADMGPDRCIWKSCQCC